MDENSTQNSFLKTHKSFFSHADFADNADFSFFHIIYPQRRPVLSDYADLSCDTLKYATARKICVICEICVTKIKIIKRDQEIYLRELKVINDSVNR